MKAELWNDVERALDARRSPFDDPSLGARLERDPEARVAVRNLVERLEALGTRRPTRRLPLVPTLVASTAAVLVAFLCLGVRNGAHEPDHLDVRLSVLHESYAPRLARVEHEATRIVVWTTEGGAP